MSNSDGECFKCNGPTSSLNNSGIRYQEKLFYLSCFNCHGCKKSLVNKKIFRNGNLFKCEFCWK